MPLWFPVLLVLGLAAATDAWVYRDAARMDEQGTPVVFATTSFTLETPESWLIACLVLWVIALPLYVTVRNQTRS